MLRILSDWRETDRMLSGRAELATLPALQDMREQLSRLVARGFLGDAGADRLRRFPTYLLAIRRRRERLEEDVLRDRQLMDQVTSIEEPVLHRLAALPEGRPPGERLRRARWMLEEYRVSLWAPIDEDYFESVPLTPGDRFFSGLESGDDPVLLAEAADRAAELLVRGARASGDDQVAERVLHLADTEGIEVIAQAWADRPAESVAGCLWRLYLLRSWVYADPVGVAREFDAGRRRATVDDVVAGVADPPGPDELRDMVDQVLRGIAVGDFADVLLRAAAFARVVATGRALLTDTDALAAARIQSVAEQLDRSAGVGRSAILTVASRHPLA